MKTLRRRKIAKQYGVTYKRQPNRNADFHMFKKSTSGFGFYHCNIATFLHVIKNKDRWGNLDFKHRK